MIAAPQSSFVTATYLFDAGNLRVQPADDGVKGLKRPLKAFRSGSRLLPGHRDSVHPYRDRQPNRGGAVRTSSRLRSFTFFLEVGDGKSWSRRR
jgi:hypothetical protein